MRILSSLIALICFTSIFAQYKNPYRMAYDGLNYYVTNNANGTVTQINSKFKTQSVISGLHEPLDIFFGSFLGNSALILIDSNKLKLYDTSNFSSLITINITNAVEAHDGVFNPKNNNEFFISDRKGNKIIRGRIGSAPFFPITFSVLTTGISKPAGLIFNDAGKLVVVTDTANAKLLEIDATTGAVSTKISTKYSRFNDVAQDNEGNYYITCWGNDNLYRYDKNYKNEYKVNSFNNPSGLYVNTQYDIMGICCTNCQKVEFYFFHLFSPLADIITCKQVDFYTDFLPSYKGIGTYNSDNVFLVEMSDSNGLFNFPTVIGSDTTSIRPKGIVAKVPASAFDNTKYRYRFRSTSPNVVSYFDKALQILNHPDAYISDLDSLQSCENGVIKVGKGAEKKTAYRWTPVFLVSDTTNSSTSLRTDTIGSFQISLSTRDSVTGCTSTTTKNYSVKQSLELSIADTLTGCVGDTLKLPLNQIPYVYSWNGSGYTIDSTSNLLLYPAPNSSKLYINFEDSSGTCSGNDSVYFQINELPQLDAVPERIWFCEGEVFNLKDYTANGKSYWHITDSLDLALTPIPLMPNYYRADSVGFFDLGYGVTDLTTNCSYSEWSDVEVRNTPDSLILRYNSDEQVYEAEVLGAASSGIISWYINDVKVTESDTLDRWRLNENDTLYAIYTSIDECEIVSRKLTFTSASVQVLTRNLSVYPNPTSHSVFVNGIKQDTEVSIFNASGILVEKMKLDYQCNEIDLSTYPIGVYTLLINGKHNLYSFKVVKLD